MLSLLVNETQDRFPSFNLLLMQHIRVGDRPYIFAMHNDLDIEVAQLSELLTLDNDAMHELSRLRSELQGVYEEIADCSLREAVRYRVVQFLPRLPSSLRPLELAETRLPLVSLELASHSDLPNVLIEGLCSGIRHFYISFDSSKEQDRQDRLLAQMEGRLRALHLGKALHDLKQRHLHYLCHAISFTLVTSPVLMSCFGEVHKTITSCGYTLGCWMLDVRGLTHDKVAQCWSEMVQAKLRREVPRLGLWGYSKQLQDFVAPNHSISLCAIEHPAGQELNPKDLVLLQKKNVATVAYNVFGRRQQLLHDPDMQAQAEALGVSPSLLAMKCVEHQGLAMVIPPLDSSLAAVARPPNGSPLDAPSYVHRAFVQRWRQAPSAEMCADAVEKVLSKPKRLLPPSPEPVYSVRRNALLHPLWQQLRRDPDSKGHTFASLSRQMENCSPDVHRPMRSCVRPRTCDGSTGSCSPLSSGAASSSRSQDRSPKPERRGDGEGRRHTTRHKTVGHFAAGGKQRPSTSDTDQLPHVHQRGRKHSFEATGFLPPRALSQRGIRPRGEQLLRNRSHQ